MTTYTVRRSRPFQIVETKTGKWIATALTKPAARILARALNRSSAADRKRAVEVRAGDV